MPGVTAFGRLASGVGGRNRNRQNQKILAGRAAIGQEVGLSLSGVGLTTDQTHQATTALAKKRRQACRLFGFDMFHFLKAKPRPNTVNSVSLQPILAQTAILEPFVPLVVSSSLAILCKSEQVTHIEV